MFFLDVWHHQIQTYNGTISFSDVYFVLLWFLKKKGVFIKTAICFCWHVPQRPNFPGSVLWSVASIYEETLWALRGPLWWPTDTGRPICVRTVHTFTQAHTQFKLVTCLHTLTRACKDTHTHTHDVINQPFPLQSQTCSRTWRACLWKDSSGLH